MGRLKVLFIINSLHIGGAEKQTISLLNGIDTKKFCLSLACLKKNVSLLPQLDKDRLESFFTCHVKHKIDLAAVKKIALFIQMNHIDIVICTNQYPMLYGVLAKKKASSSCRVIEVLHSTLPNSLKDKLQWFLYRHVFKYCDHVVFVSKNQARYWLQDRGLRASAESVIFNGIDVAKFQNYVFSGQSRQKVMNQHSLKSHSILIGICAVLRPEKRHVDLVDAVAYLRNEGIDAGLLIIGDGPERLNISKYVASVPSLTESVYFTGLQQDVRPFIALCHCMVISSDSVETFSISALESMAMGKPLIMTNIGGASEQVTQGENGFLYQPGDTDALVSLLKSINNTDLRKAMGCKAIKKVSEKFTLSHMIKEYELLFNEYASLKNLECETR